MVLIIEGTGKRVADSHNGTAGQEPVLHVEYTTGGGPVNTAPMVTIGSPSNGSAFTVGDLISFTGSATDAEDGNISASLDWDSDLDGNLQMNSASFSTTGLSVGTHTITVSTTDSGGLPGSDVITITVNAPGNTAPVVTITAPADLSTSTVGDSVTFTGTANDTEDGNISASLDWDSNLDGNLQMNSASFSTTGLSVGTHTITASTTDSGGLPGSDVITITVNAPGNTAPVVTITAPADLSTSTVGDSVTFTGTANDTEDGNISASLDWDSNLDGNLQMNSASFSTTGLSVGTHTITASTTDSGLLPGSDSITVTVNSGGVMVALDVAVSMSSDDAEERQNSSLRMFTASNDLELVDDGSRNQYVGLRFNGITIPPERPSPMPMSSFRQMRLIQVPFQSPSGERLTTIRQHSLLLVVTSRPGR